MTEVTGNLWTYSVPDKRIIKCITTNGTIKRNQEAVLGRGCALEAATRYPVLPRILGVRLLREGLRLHYIQSLDLVCFPVKYQWHQNANISLIIESSRELCRLAKVFGDAIFVLPRPGCGNGRLEWSFVRNQIEPYLPDNVHVITNQLGRGPADGLRDSRNA